LRPSCVEIGEFEGEVGEETQLLVLVLDQWIVNVGEVVVDDNVGMDEDGVEVVSVESAVVDDERREEDESGGSYPFRTRIPLIRCKC
jgi:hypothetical protein